MHRLKDSWGKAKLLLSQLLCIGAMFTACTDDDTIVQSDKAPLQISVSAKAPAVSRTIIDGSSLPDGSHIGVSVFDADGGDYDGQDYFNLKYTAAGEGEGQSWSTTTPASLSTTMAVVAAYFPYIDNDALDLTAVPVETASQTDYMYSGAVAGANMSSPEVILNMSHALANIHVNIKKGTYTGTGEVSQMTVKAAAFATTATMNVFDGTLDNIDGKGAEFTQKIIDAAISAGMVEQDFLVVPDGSSESGNISLSVTVDGKKFTAGIDYDEAFQHGYTYTYNLTLNNEDLKVEAVEVLPWGEKASFDEGLDLYDDEYVVEINIPSDGYNYIHNIYNGFVGTIDWGDGKVIDYSYTTNRISHVYTKAGNYIVKAEGKINSIFSSSDCTRRITKLINIGKDCGVTSLSQSFSEQNLLSEIKIESFNESIQSFWYSFSECTSLTSIPANLFKYNTEVKSFEATFEGCSKLQAIPEGLFDNNTKVTNFYLTFKGCESLQTIPEGLFDNCTEVTNFGGTFEFCYNLKTIPVGLFNACPKVTTFESTFFRCKSLQAIPQGLFDKNTKVTSFAYTFGNLSNYSDSGNNIALTNIPEGLFDHCPQVTSFEGTFARCKALKSIPAGLFDKCTKVTSFAHTFYDCNKISSILQDLFKNNTKVTNFSWAFGKTGITTIPGGLFKNNIEAKNFGGSFANCKTLRSIPAGLFDNNTKVTDFNGTFQGCASLQTIPEGLFDNCTEVTSFAAAFYDCTNLQTIPAGLFDKCTKVTSFGNAFFKTNITEIPAGLFDYNTKVTTFGSTFAVCTNITTIPEGLFDKCTEVTSFERTFYSCQRLETIPAELFDKCTEALVFKYTFRECTSLKDVPAGLFDKCTKATDFNEAFYGCSNLQEVPVGLFDKCTKVMNFQQTFMGCVNLTGESPYTTINIDGVDTKIHLYERANYPGYFTATPTSFSRCFYNCTQLTDYSSIPSDWK